MSAQTEDRLVVAISSRALFDLVESHELASANTRLRPGDVLVAPPFAVGVSAVDVPGLGMLAANHLA